MLTCLRLIGLSSCPIVFFRFFFFPGYLCAETKNLPSPHLKRPLSQPPYKRLLFDGCVYVSLIGSSFRSAFLADRRCLFVAAIFLCSSQIRRRARTYIFDSSQHQLRRVTFLLFVHFPPFLLFDF